MNWVPEPETREGYLADNRKRVLLVPLAASRVVHGANRIDTWRHS